MEALNIIKRLENEIYKDYNTDHRPPGVTWVYMVLDLSRRILDRVGLSSITPDILEALTEDNYHTARHAAEIVLHLQEYVI